MLKKLLFVAVILFACPCVTNADGWGVTVGPGGYGYYHGYNRPQYRSYPGYYYQPYYGWRYDQYHYGPTVRQPYRYYNYGGYGHRCH